MTMFLFSLGFSWYLSTDLMVATMSAIKIGNCLLIFKYVTTTFIYLLISFPTGLSDALAMLTKTGFFNFGMVVCLSSIGSTLKIWL